MSRGIEGNGVDGKGNVGEEGNIGEEGNGGEERERREMRFGGAGRGTVC